MKITNCVVILTLLLTSIGVHAASNDANLDRVSTISNPNNTWRPRASNADSYSVGNECFIDSTFDHAANFIFSTPQGPKTARQIADAQNGPGPSGRPIYNDIQCGNGPANNFGDENQDQCPGRVDLGQGGCNIIGPTFNLDRLFPSSNTPVVTTPTPAGVCATGGATRAEAMQTFDQFCPTFAQRDCDPAPGGDTFVCSSQVGQKLTIDHITVLETIVDTTPTPTPVVEVVTTPVPVQVPGFDIETGRPLETEVCGTRGSTLAEAKETFVEFCPTFVRQDCDPLSDGSFVCYSVAGLNLNDSHITTEQEVAPVPVVTPEPVEVVVTPEPLPAITPDPESVEVVVTPEPVITEGDEVDSPEVGGLSCGAIGRAAFVAQCGNVPADCDPVNGQMYCTNYMQGLSAPAGVPTLDQLMNRVPVTPLPVIIDDENVEVTPLPVIIDDDNVEVTPLPVIIDDENVEVIVEVPAPTTFTGDRYVITTKTDGGDFAKHTIVNGRCDVDGVYACIDVDGMGLEVEYLEDDFISIHLGKDVSGEAYIEDAANKSSFNTSTYDLDEADGSCVPAATSRFCQSAVDEVATLWQLTLDMGAQIHITQVDDEAFTNDVLAELSERAIEDLR